MVNPRWFWKQHFWVYLWIQIHVLETIWCRKLHLGDCLLNFWIWIIRSRLCVKDNILIWKVCLTTKMIKSLLCEIIVNMNQYHLIVKCLQPLFCHVIFVPYPDSSPNCQMLEKSLLTISKPCHDSKWSTN